MTGTDPNRKFSITTAWVRQADESPWLTDAYCDNGENAWGGEPESFADAVSKHLGIGDEVRIVKINVDYDQIEALFNEVEIDGIVQPEGEDR